MSELAMDLMTTGLLMVTLAFGINMLALTLLAGMNRRVRQWLRERRREV